MHDLHPKDAIRWAVGNESGRRSSTWRLWGDKKGDIYVSMRNLGSQLKASIHRDRRCHLGFTSEFAKEAAQRFGTSDRHWGRWELPNESVVRAIQIVIPDSELDTFETEEKNPMRWISAPGPGRAQVFSVFISEPSNAFVWESEEKNGHLIGTLISPTRSTWLVHTEQELDRQTLEMIEASREQMYRLTAPEQLEGSEDGLRMTIWGQSGAKNDVFFVELNAAKLQKT